MAGAQHRLQCQCSAMPGQRLKSLDPRYVDQIIGVQCSSSADKLGAGERGRSMTQQRRCIRVDPVTPTNVYNSHICGGGYSILIDLRGAEEFDSGHIPMAINLPPPCTLSDTLPRQPPVQSSQSPFVIPDGWPNTMEEMMMVANDDAVDNRLEARSLRPVILYEDGTAPHKSRWMKTVMRLFLYDGRALCVTHMLGGFAAFRLAYPFAQQVQRGSMLRTYPSEIVRGRLYLGGQQHSTDEAVMKDLQITHVVNAANTVDDFGRGTFEHLGVRYFYVDVEDMEDSDLYSHFALVYKFVEEAMQDAEANRVLIHCQLGVSRSAALAIYYVMRKHRLSLAKAFVYVWRQRPQVYPNRGFRAQLRRAEKQLYGRASITEEALALLGDNSRMRRHDTSHFMSTELRPPPLPPCVVQ